MHPGAGGGAAEAAEVVHAAGARALAPAALLWGWQLLGRVLLGFIISEIYDLGWGADGTCGYRSSSPPTKVGI